jgi:phosphoglycerate dehydrogenase-like enzyme
VGDAEEAMLTTNEPLDRPGPPERMHEMLARSDDVVVTASLDSASRRLLGDAEFRTLTPGAGLVNVARGGLVDQEALLAALAVGRVCAAVLDVVPQPLPPEHPLWAHPREIVTSHISNGGPKGWARSMDFFRWNVPLYLDAEADRLGNVVDLADNL